LRVLSIAFVVLLSACATSQRATVLHVEKQWVRSTLEKEYLGARRIHRFTPIVTDNLVIAGNSIDGIVAYDRHSAREKWRMHIADGVESGAYLFDGILYFGAGDGFFYAVNSTDGQLLWSYPLKAEGLGKPMLSGEDIYVLGGNNVAHSLKAKTGKLNWVYTRRDASSLSIRGGSQPLVSDQTVYFGFSDGSLVALERSTGNVEWEVNLNPNKRFRDVDDSPILENNIIYVSSYDGKLYALAKEDGKTIWSTNEGGYDRVLLSGKSLFLSSTSGKILAIDKTTGKTIWSKVNPHGISTGPQLWRGVLLVAEMGGALRFLDGRTGEFITTFEPGRGVTSTPYVDKKTNDVYFMSADANLFALRLDWRKAISEWPWEEL
jgi:outer membrane protein assembly factor BamB